MTLEHLISMLSKSSAQAVTTLSSSSPEARKLKGYLHVKTPVEKALREALERSPGRNIIFLCGSSGDGKSETFRQIYKEYSQRVEFHLDATHSFDPSKNAIQTLDDLFTQHKQGSKPLVVGINIGMLGNYAAEGSEDHADIRAEIGGFLQGRSSSSDHSVFISFERFPKFVLRGGEVGAPFIGPLLQKICAEKESNPFYSAYVSGNRDSKLSRNYALLSIPEVQSQICKLLFYAHLKFDQFLTARTVLDFVYQLLLGDGILFDNLFCGGDSELFQALRKLDPSHLRSRALDLFQVKGALGLYDEEFEIFRSDLEKQYGICLHEPRSWVRLFYLLQDLTISNDYHKGFENDLQRVLFDDYQHIWQLHRDFDGNDKERKKKIRDFYDGQFISAIMSFANRFAPEIKQDRILLGKRDGYVLSAPARISPSLSRLANAHPTSLRFFEAHLGLENSELSSVPVSINFMELVDKINRGYRPNTHDKTTVVVLEELVEQILRSLRKTEILYIQMGGKEWRLRDNHAEDEIVVES